MEEQAQRSIVGEYEKLDSERNVYLLRARECALYTIPTLVPPATKGSVVKFKTPYQGVGARGLNNLASKLLLALFPPSQPFFRLSVDDSILEKMGKSRGDAEEALSTIEKRIVGEINASSIRVQLFEALKQLVVAGNVLLYFPPKETNLRVFRLDRYVVVRDAMGNVLKMITHEDISWYALPKDIQDQLKDLDDGDKMGKDNDEDEENIPVYTLIELNAQNKWEVVQEVRGQIIESTRVTYPKDKCPWMPLRLISVDNESYGRSYVEEYLGDLKSLEGLTKAIIEASAAAAKLLIFVNPNGTTRKKNIAEAPNLAILEGNAADVTMLRSDKQADLQTAERTAQVITERLSYAFMLNSAVQRSGERVTAEEIRFMASELEDSLGGIYSVLSQELQLQLVSLIMTRMQRQGKIPALPKGMVKPTITTGMEALGRTADLQKLDAFLQSLAILGQDTLAQYLNIDEYIKRRASALQVDTKNLVKSQAEVEAKVQQAQMAQMMQAAAPNAVKGVMDAANQQPQTESPQQ